MTQPGADHLHHLLRAWGLGLTAISVFETLLAVVLAAVGIMLWQLGAEEWVSLFLLLMLALTFRLASDRAWERLNRRIGAVATVQQVQHSADEGVVLAGLTSSGDPGPGSDSAPKSSRGGDR